MLDVLQSYAFAVKHGLGILEAHHYRCRLAAADSVVQQSDTCEAILVPDCELTARGELEHRLKQASVQYSIVMDQLNQVGSSSTPLAHIPGHTRGSP